MFAQTHHPQQTCWASYKVVTALHPLSVHLVAPAGDDLRDAGAEQPDDRDDQGQVADPPVALV